MSNRKKVFCLKKYHAKCRSGRVKRQKVPSLLFSATSSRIRATTRAYMRGIRGQHTSEFHLPRACFFISNVRRKSLLVRYYDKALCSLVLQWFLSKFDMVRAVYILFNFWKNHCKIYFGSGNITAYVRFEGRLRTQRSSAVGY